MVTSFYHLMTSYWQQAHEVNTDSEYIYKYLSVHSCMYADPFEKISLFVTKVPIWGSNNSDSSYPQFSDLQDYLSPCLTTHVK